MLGLITGAAITGLGSILSGSIQRKKAKKEKKMLDSQMDSLEKWYNEKSKEDYLNTDAVKSTLSLLKDQNNKNLNASTNNMIRNGVTDEVRVATASELNKNYADAVSKISGMGTAYKQDIENKYMGYKNAIDNNKLKLSVSSPNYSSTFGDVASSVGSQLQTLSGLGVFKPKNKKQ